MKKILLALLLIPALVFGQATGLVISNKPSGGAIGTAAATVDAATLFNLNQTTAGQTLTVPNLTNASAGKIIYIRDVGTTSLTLSPGGLLLRGKGAILSWTGTMWNVCGIGIMPHGISGITNNYIPRATSDTTLGDSWLYQSADSIKITDGKIITSANGNSILDFVSGSGFYLKVKNGTSNTQISLSPTSSEIAGGSVAGGYHDILGQTSELTLRVANPLGAKINTLTIDTNKIELVSPYIKIPDNGYGFIGGSDTTDARIQIAHTNTPYGDVLLLATGWYKPQGFTLSANRLFTTLTQSSSYSGLQSRIKLDTNSIELYSSNINLSGGVANKLLFLNGGKNVRPVYLGSGLALTDSTLTSTGSGGTVTSVAALTLGTSGTDLTSSVANSTTTPVITLNVPTASASNRGALSSTDWSTFNNKVSTTRSISTTAPVIGGGDLSADRTISVDTSKSEGRLATYHDVSLKLAKTDTSSLSRRIDAAVSGQRAKEAVKYVTTAALPTVVYANGSSGVGATLTGFAVGAISLDGASPGVGDRIEVKNQVSTFQNGIYVVTQTGSGIAVFILTRATDFDQAADIQTGDMVFVTAGTANTNLTYAYNGIDSPTMGTDAITFVQSAGVYTAGNGISITSGAIAINTSVTADKTTAQTFTNKDLSSATNTFPSTFVLRETMADADKTFSSGKTEVYTTATLTAPRVLNLPAASAFPAGTELIFTDEFGAVSSTGTLTVTRAGSDLINGLTTFVLYSPNVIFKLITDGSSKWTGGVTTAGSDGQYTAWIPTLTGFSVNPTGGATKYILNGKSCTLYMSYTTNGTTNNTAVTVTLPFAASNNGVQLIVCRIVNNGTASFGYLATRANSNVADVYTGAAQTVWSASANSRFIVASFTYETN